MAWGRDVWLGNAPEVAFATAEVLFLLCLQPQYPRFHDEAQRVAPPESQVVLSGCTIMFQSVKSEGILRAHRHSLFSFTIQTLVQYDLLKYWFAGTARYQNAKLPQPLANSPSLVLKRTLDQNLSSDSTLVTPITTHFFQFRLISLWTGLNDDSGILSRLVSLV